ncbi:unnamed protein product [Pleuronectes platessa]|uniref:Uncharacterized protein n=1 Tax=Pleuronectes platessa TaxID=8262 RepID=A0A9N7Z213_PLEPL|nr:unnamed protein product [Pleuronectes platessa]
MSSITSPLLHSCTIRHTQRSGEENAWNGRDWQITGYVSVLKEERRNVEKAEEEEEGGEFEEARQKYAKPVFDPTMAGVRTDFETLQESRIAYRFAFQLGEPTVYGLYLL